MGLLKSIGVGKLLDSLVEQEVLYAKRALGQAGKEIKVYKIRTMKPGSDQLIDIVGKEKLVDKEGNTVLDERRIEARKWLRKYGIDELPQLYNILEGEMAIVGIRPKEAHFWAQLEDKYPGLSERALQFKPGWMPVERTKRRTGNLDDFIETERRYIEEKEKAPLRTDLKYIGKFLYAVVFMGMRSG